MRVFLSATVMINRVSGAQKKTEVPILKSVLPLANLAKYTNTNSVAKKPWFITFTVTAVSVTSMK